MKQYLDFCKHVMDNGLERKDRTGVGTKGVFGHQMRFDLSEGFPLLTTKKVHMKSIVHELLWIMKGDTNIRYLAQNKVRIWDDWPYKKFVDSTEFNGETIREFAAKVAEDEDFANRYGDLGPVYGKQWRDFFGADQLLNVVKSLKENPFSRRHIISAWNPAQIQDMALPPCHAFIQFYVSSENKLSCQLYQRSADIFLGVPFNIASYSVLTHMLCKILGYEPGDFVHSIGDAHIYQNHYDQVNLQLTRTPKKLPKLVIHGDQKTIEDFKYEDFEIVDYNPEPGIKAPVAV